MRLLLLFLSLLAVGTSAAHDVLLVNATVIPAPDQPAVVHETPVRLDADGVAGYGIYEHLVTEFD